MRISFIEFQESISKYVELAKTQDIIVNADDNVLFKVVPFEETVKYNPEFVQNILQVNEEAEKGYVVKVNDANDIWKDIL